MIRVSNLDAAMLYAETPEMPMHTMGVLVLDPGAEPGDLLDMTEVKRAEVKRLFRKFVV